MKMEVDKSINTICNLKHATRALSVAGVLGVAGFVLALVKDRNLRNLSWLSPKEHRLEKLCLVPGLHNHGNNCFLNVILQALASCSYFQPFLQHVIKDSELATNGDRTQTFQLTAALDALLEELSVFGERRNVVSPRKVMLAMANSVQNFSLTSQQDAEEAFLYLLSSLREEFSDSYAPNHSSLADAFCSSNFRVLAPKRMEIMSEQERWKQLFLGPFNGILSSRLTCQTCSSQISLNFQFFHSLPLLPVLENGDTTTIMPGCTLEDCLKRFTIADQVENYKCSNCWHIAAVKFLSLEGAKETEIEKLRTCSMQGSCTCHSLPPLKLLPWSNKFVCTLKQLAVARCPMILCIHLQRASINRFGEPVKLQGHVRFPLIFNMLPFTLEKVQYEKPSSSMDYFNVQCYTRMQNSICGQSTYSRVLAANKYRCIEHIEAILGKSSLCLDALHTDVGFKANDEAGGVRSSKPLLYRLVSVVEHFGRVGGGHYTVYRSVRSESLEECDGENVKPSFRTQWFCISDSNVNSVAEEDALGAEASLLFYEQIV